MKKLITQKDSLKDSISLIALMSALSAIMIVFVTYLPISSIVFTFLLPLPSIIISLYIKDKYYIIYFLSALILSLIVGVGDIGYALTSILPSLIIAFVIGLMIKHKFSIYFTFVVSSIILFILNLCSICILNYLFNIKLITLVSDILNIKNNLSFLNLTVIYFYSLIQTFLILLVSLDQIKFLVKDIVSKNSNCFIEASFSVSSSIISIILFKYDLQFAYLFLVISLVSTIYLLTFKAKTLQKSIIFGVIIIFTWLIYILILSKTSTVYSFITLNLIPLILALYVLIYNLVCLFREKYLKL